MLFKLYKHNYLLEYDMSIDVYRNTNNYKKMHGMQMRRGENNKLNKSTIKTLKRLRKRDPYRFELLKHGTASEYNGEQISIRTLLTNIVRSPCIDENARKVISVDSLKFSYDKNKMKNKLANESIRPLYLINPFLEIDKLHGEDHIL